MNAQELLQEISDYCRHTGLAESTFGRRAVNDGKLTSRLRNGGRITTETLDRIRTFMTIHDGKESARPMIIERGGRPATIPNSASMSPPPANGNAGGADDGNREFRFFDNRQKYLLFVNTCCEKWVVANKVAQELGNIHPRPPAVRAVRRRPGRRHGADARDARDASPLSEHAVLYFRQGNQPRGHPPHAGEDAGPALRASLDRARAHQHVLFRGAVADGEVDRRRQQPGLERGRADRQHLARFRGADHRSAGLPRRELEGRRQRQDRQPDLRAAGGAGDLPAGPQIPARPDHPEARRGAMPISIWSSPRSPIARALRPSSRRRR